MKTRHFPQATLCAAALASLTTVAAFAQPVALLAPAPPTRITVNGKAVEADQRPLLVKGEADLGTQILVPIRFVVEALGAVVYWDPEARTAVVIRGANNIALRVGGDTHTVNGLKMTTRAPVRIVGGRTMVPVRFVSNALGADVAWDSRTRTVAISFPTAAPASRQGDDRPLP